MSYSTLDYIKTAIADLAEEEGQSTRPHSLMEVRSDWRAAASMLLRSRHSLPLQSLQDSAQKVKHSIFSSTVYPISPLYVTSICAERCTYCNYRADNKNIEISRLRLSPEELAREVQFLAESEGIRVIELVYATDPYVRIDEICRNVEDTKNFLAGTGGGAVGINAEAFDYEEYIRLRQAGIDFVVLWQETYDRERYTEIHPGKTKKCDINYRVEAFDRMIAAGINSFGMGILSGLSDWRTDWAFLFAHEGYLLHKYGAKPAILGVPRLKCADGALLKNSDFIPTDEEFSFVISLHNLFSPETLPFINTRESWALCTALAAGGGCLFTLNCSTIPGGYSLGSKGYQFPTLSYSASTYRAKLEQEHLVPIMNWCFDARENRVLAFQ